jgi:hypothetical protein
MRFSALAFGFLALIMAPACPASIPCKAVRPPVLVSLKQSDVVVAATARAVSVKIIGGHSRQTIIWSVNEVWKGPHYKGSTFTTRTNAADPIARGQSFLLYLSGEEPYEINICSDRSAPLQNALPDVRELYREFDRARRLGPNNSFKPTPLRGAA